MHRIAALIALIALATLPGSTAAQERSEPPPDPTRAIRVFIAPHPDLDAIDLSFDPIWEDIQLNQQQMAALTGHFFQGLPTNGADNPGTPTDYPYTWTQFLPLPGPLPYTIQIDVYEGPHGPGYSVLLSAEAGGQTWQRSIAYGLEPGRTWYWRLVVDEVAE